MDRQRFRSLLYEITSYLFNSKPNYRNFLGIDFQQVAIGEISKQVDTMPDSEIQLHFDNIFAIVDKHRLVTKPIVTQFNIQTGTVKAKLNDYWLEKEKASDWGMNLLEALK